MKELEDLNKFEERLKNSLLNIKDYDPTSLDGLEET